MGGGGALCFGVSHPCAPLSAASEVDSRISYACGKFLPRCCLNTSRDTLMTRTTSRRERRKKSLASAAADGHAASKPKVKKGASSVAASHKANGKAPLVGIIGKLKLVKRPAPRKQQKSSTRKVASAPGANFAGGGKKKRSRSETHEQEDLEESAQEEGEEEEEPPQVDELVATIQEHDEFFSRMLDMIPEHLVLPAKEVTESSYASKYMKASAFARALVVCLLFLFLCLTKKLLLLVLYSCALTLSSRLLSFSHGNFTNSGDHRGLTPTAVLLVGLCSSTARVTP